MSGTSTTARHPLRVRLRTVAVALVVLAVGSLALAWSGGLGGDRTGLVLAALPHPHVDVPPADASPDEVVDAYLRALPAHDLRTAEALYPSGADYWVGNVRSLTYSTAAPTSAHPAVPGTVWVNVELTLRQFDAEGMEDGTSSWSYGLRRVHGSGPWRIISEGQG